MPFVLNVGGVFTQAFSWFPQQVGSLELPPPELPPLPPLDPPPLFDEPASPPPPLDPPPPFELPPLEHPI